MFEWRQLSTKKPRDGRPKLKLPAGWSEYILEAQRYAGKQRWGLALHMIFPIFEQVLRAQLDPAGLHARSTLSELTTLAEQSQMNRFLIHEWNKWRDLRNRAAHGVPILTHEECRDVAEMVMAVGAWVRDNYA